MLEYKFMDESFIVPVCLHAGPVDIASLAEISAETQFEKQFHLTPGSHASVLKAIAAAYGASGIAAIENNKIVGLCRFYPAVLTEMLSSPLCPQDESKAAQLSAFDVEKLISFENLCPKSLQIGCFQIIPAYQSRGIGSIFLEKIIEWATEKGWFEIDSDALQDIFPILAWSGHMSYKTLQKYGFTVTEQTDDSGIKEAAQHMRLGYHSEAIKKIWEEQYADIPDDFKFIRYKMRLVL